MRCKKWWVCESYDMENCITEHCFVPMAEAPESSAPSGQAGFDLLYFTEHSDRNGVKMRCYDKEYNFGKKVAEQMLRELRHIVELWGD